MIWVHVYSGLTSRCYTIAEAHELVKMSGGGQKLIIIWPRGEDCNISYHEIFEENQFSDIDVKVIEPISFRVNNGGILYNLKQGRLRQAAYAAFIKTREKAGNLFIILLRSFYERKQKYFNYQPPVDVGWSGHRYVDYMKSVWENVEKSILSGSSCYIHAFCGLAKTEKKAVYGLDQLKFKQVYWDKVDDIMGTGKRYAGVHIRRTDHETAIAASSTSSFAKRMRKIEQEQPDIKFFLATDDVREKEEMRRLFGEKIVLQEEMTWGRNTTAGMKSGLIDCLCLSRCEYILGSYTSVFSSFAAAFGKKELFICMDDKE